jgi:hypothetical protein
VYLKYKNKETKETLVQLNQIRLSTQTLIDCADDFALMKKSVDNLYRVFSDITSVTMDQLSTDKDIMLASGKAISTAAAAHCLLEMKRTAVFLRGINKALLSKISEVNKMPIRILYAGTGPYGTLVIPLLTLFKPEMLKVDMLDINSHSLEALHKIVDRLNFNDFVEDMYCEDATTFRVSKTYDVVISETMLACLKNEPQVAIMQNLIPQLTKECLFIPEKISVDACLINHKMEQDRMMCVEGEKPLFERRPLGNVFTVSKQNMNSITEKKSFSIPDDAVAAFPALKLFTTVTVYNNEVLTENDSSITMPKQHYDFRNENSRGIEFWYVKGEKPRIESRVIKPVEFFVNAYMF